MTALGYVRCGDVLFPIQGWARQPEGHERELIDVDVSYGDANVVGEAAMAMHPRSMLVRFAPGYLPAPFTREFYVTATTSNGNPMRREHMVGTITLAPVVPP